MKNTKNFKLFALLAAILAFAALISGCSGEGGGDISSDIPATEAQERELALFSGGETDFIIVRPDKADNIKPYSNFRKNMREVSGFDIEFDTDAFYRNHEYSAEKYEILCGNVNYPEAKGRTDGMAFNEYKIAVAGNKIVISAKTDEALTAGMDAFISYVKENIKEGTLIIKEDFSLSGETELKGFDLLIKSVPAVDGYSSAVLSECGDGYVQATLSGSSAGTFEGYCTALENDGFALYAENEMAENTFATYTKGGINVHSYYTPHNEEMRVIVSENTVLPLKDEVTYTKVCEPTVTLMGLEKSGSGGGLGMIIGLEDGSFIVIDSGNNTQIEADDLANTLKKLSPDKNTVTIRAWFFTHAHGDHTGAFHKFSRLYGRSGNFKVERFVFNFCDAESQRVYGGLSYDTTLNTINIYWKKAVCHKALTGEVYRFAGCDIEMLYCMSDFIPQIIGAEKGIGDIDKEKIDGNIECIVFRAFVGGQKFLVTGDTSKVNVDEMCDRYGSYLKSDILQVPHHGHNSNRYRARNGTVEFYRLVDPSVALWPSDEKGFTDRTNWNGKSGSNYEANYYLAYKLNVKELIVAGKTTRTLTLPYLKTANT